MAIELERRGQLLQQACRQTLCCVGRGVWQQQGEFVAAQSVDLVGPAYDLAHAFGNPLQQQVATVMAETVIDFLETVQVQEEQGQGLGAAYAVAEQVLQLFGKGLAIAQLGQRVAIGHVEQAVLVVQLCADVAQDAVVAEQAAAVVAQYRDMRIKVAAAAVGAAERRGEVTAAGLQALLEQVAGAQRIGFAEQFAVGAAEQHFHG